MKVIFFDKNLKIIKEIDNPEYIPSRKDFVILNGVPRKVSEINIDYDVNEIYVILKGV